MKYCPYCGASLPDSAVSFCPECGKSMPESKSGTTMPDKPAQEKKSRKKAKKEKATPPKRSKLEPPSEDDYDGYYDDCIPIDEGHRRDGLDKGIIKKVIALVLCLLVVIGACVAILCLI